MDIKIELSGKTYDFVSEDGNFRGKMIMKKKDGYCLKCKKDIFIDDVALSVEKNEKFIGFYHLQCFSDRIFETIKDELIDNIGEEL